MINNIKNITKKTPDNNIFRTDFGETIFNNKYRHENCETWEKLSGTLIKDVCGGLLSEGEIKDLIKIHSEMKFVAGGRYLYYAGRINKFFNNCYLLKAEEDTREDWASLSWRSESCLMTGGGIGIDYSIYRPHGAKISRTGGEASGPIPKMKMINEIGRNVMQGGSRRSAIYASLNWRHGDANSFLHCKDWYNMPISGAYKKDGTNLTVGLLKEMDFNYPAPLDMTNISLNYDNKFLESVYDLPINKIEKIFKKGEIPEIKYIPSTFIDNCRQALKTGEPGFSFNFFNKENETLRNAPITGSTRVLTKNGYTSVYSTLGHEIEIWTGERFSKTKFKLTKSNSELIEIKLTNGRSIICDPEHPFIARNYNGAGSKRRVTTNRVKANNLKLKQKIESKLPENEVLKTSKELYGYGFVFGDGSIKNGYGDISFFAENKKSSFNRAKKSLSARKAKNDNRAYFSTSFNSKDELLPLCKFNDFIAGWFDADGCFTRNLLRLSCKNLDHLNTLRESLDLLGIKSTVRKDGKSSYKPENIMYTLTILSSSLLNFKKKINTSRIKINVKNNWKPYRESEIRVKEIINLDYKEDVYCCDVNVEEHSFMAEGVLISNCTEVTSEDDSDVCNLGSLNMSRFDNIEEWAKAVELGTKFLLCGTLKADLPFEKVHKTRKKNRRLGLGLMGVHEWLLRRGYKYEVNDELKQWLEVYKNKSREIADIVSRTLKISNPVAVTSVAPTGTIGILTGTSTGIEPLFAVSYKRRYLKGDKEWHYQYVIDGTAKNLISKYELNPDDIESAIDLSKDYERRIKFQADIQDYVDMSISSTINLPKWGTELNNETRVTEFAKVLLKYAHRLRGFTCYPDGSRGGQPLTTVSYKEAKEKEGKEFKEEFHDICEITGGGTCGL